MLEFFRAFQPFTPLQCDTNAQTLLLILLYNAVNYAALLAMFFVAGYGLRLGLGL